MPQLPPTTTSSSMMTGSSPTGSSTPPICAAAERCTRLPICAHEPTSACESIIVSSSTYAPTLTYAGGIITTPLRDVRAAPDRRAARARCGRRPATLKRRAGIVSLSMNDSAPDANSASTPKRKASRIPFLHPRLRVPARRPRRARRRGSCLSPARRETGRSSSRASIRSVVGSDAPRDVLRSGIRAITSKSALLQDRFELLPVRFGDRRERRADGVVVDDAEHLAARP